jgi:hypothetical protein
MGRSPTASHGEYSCEHLSETPMNVSATNTPAISEPHIEKSSADRLGITKALEPSTTDGLLTSAIYTQIEGDRTVDNISLTTYRAGYNIIDNFFGQHDIGLEAVNDVEKPAK